MLIYANFASYTVLNVIIEQYNSKIPTVLIQSNGQTSVSLSQTVLCTRSKRIRFVIEVYSLKYAVSYKLDQNQKKSSKKGKYKQIK